MPYEKVSVLATLFAGMIDWIFAANEGAARGWAGGLADSHGV